MEPTDPCNSGKLQIQLQSNVPLYNKEIQVVATTRGEITLLGSYGPMNKPKDKCQDTDSIELGHYTCTNIPNKIRCLDGWRGDNCLTPICPKGCFKGVCRKPDNCSCRRGWSGSTCNECVIHKDCVNGCCAYGGDCYCFPGYKGFLCDQLSKRPSRPPTCYKQEEVPKPKPYDPNQHEEMRIFSRNITLEIPTRLFPSARFVIWFMHQGPNQTEFVSTFLSLANLKSCMNKEIPTSFIFKQATVLPGQKTSATIMTTGRKPKCALAISDIALEAFGQGGGVSQSQLMKELEAYVKKQLAWHYLDPYNILKSDHCRRSFNRPVPRVRRRIMPWGLQSADSSTPFRNAGVFVLSNVPIITAPCRPMYRSRAMALASPRGGMMLRRKGSSKPSALKARVRSFFPETWKFELLESPDSTLNLTVPDSMTTWKATMYCLSPSGLGISSPSRLVVFQPFFLQMVLPYSLIRGETAKVPVKVFSYLEACTEIVLTMKSSAHLQTNGPQTATSCLCSFQQITAYFKVKPKTLGRVPIEVHAESRPSAKCSRGAKAPTVKPVADAVRRQLLVEPEGIPEHISVGDLLCPSTKSASVSFALKTPTDQLNIVKGSERAYVIWSGNVLGSSMENLGNLLQMPYGCGEQNMASTVPSIYVLLFFNKTATKKPDVMRKARKFIVIGYQRQLKYRLKDGSYSAFGEADKQGSTWLTAFVFKSFVAASRYTSVDRQVLTSALNFLLSKAQANGCFREDGRVFSSYLKGGMGRGADEVSITAYILSALVEAQSLDPSLRNETSEGIESALRCLKLDMSSNTTSLQSLSTYTIAMRTYALAKWNPNVMPAYRNELRRREIREDGFVFWRGQQKAKKSRYRRPWLRYSSADVETTAYALLSRLETLASRKGSDVVPLLPTARWLTSQRNDRGGWYSTQDTVMGLQALSTLGTSISSGGKGTNIKLAVRAGDVSRKAIVDNSNKLVLSKMAVAVPSVLTIEASGDGCLLVQANVLFNVHDVGRPGAPFSVYASASQAAGDCQASSIRVCARYTGDKAESNMAVIKARMASGWEVPTEALDKLSGSTREGGLRRAESEPDRSLVLYFDYFTATNTCVSFDVTRAVEVADVKPMLVQVYDYYSPDEVQEKSVSVYSKACAASVFAANQ